MRVLWKVEADSPLEDFVNSLAQFLEKYPNAVVSAIGRADPDNSFATEVELYVADKTNP